MGLFNCGENHEMSLVFRYISELKEKMRGLYILDKHATERPKVDILDDDVFRDIRSMETSIYELQEKVEKLEKKK